MNPDDRGTQLGLPLPRAARTPVLTYALIGVNVFLWLLMTAAGGSTDSNVLLDFGAMFGPLLADGQYWRLFTAMFLHVGWLHLALNGFGLFIFGRIVERAFGHYRFITIYLLTGLAGGVASYLLNSITIAAGASGAIFGIIGALGAFFLAQRRILGPLGRQNFYGIAVLVAINLVLGLMFPRIDNWAHMGGLVAGFALGMLLSPRYRVLTSDFGIPLGLSDDNPLFKNLWVVPAALALLALGTWLGTATLPENAQTHVYRAERHFERQDYEAALTEVQRAIEIGPPASAGQAHYLRARILVDLGDVDGARSDLGLAIQLGDRETRIDAIGLLLQLQSRR